MSDVTSDWIVSILVVCRANECRSPAAAAMMHHQLDRRGVSARVASAGIEATAGASADRVMSRMLATRGLDLADHLSRSADSEAVAGADLIIALSRAHLRSLVADRGAPLGRTFTLLELERRAAAHPARGDAEDLAAWLARIAGPRKVADLIGRDRTDDVADPTGLGEPEYRRCLAVLERSVTIVCERGFPDRV